MWCEEFKIKNNLAEILQNLTFPHFPFFEIFAQLRYSHAYMYVPWYPVRQEIEIAFIPIYIFPVHS